jgi:hypothetical protein
MNAMELGKLKNDAKTAYEAWNAHKTEREAERNAAIAKAHEDCTAQVWDADPARKAGEHLEAVKKVLIDDRGAWTSWCGVEGIPLSTACFYRIVRMKARPLLRLNGNSSRS